MQNWTSVYEIKFELKKTKVISKCNLLFLNEFNIGSRMDVISELIDRMISNLDSRGQIIFIIFLESILGSIFRKLKLLHILL